MASNEGHVKKKTLKRRAATAIDVDFKLKNLRKIIERDDINAVEVEETSPEHLGISVAHPHEVFNQIQYSLILHSKFKKNYFSRFQLRTHSAT
jgi:hypothetical protein